MMELTALPSRSDSAIATFYLICFARLYS